MCSILTSGKRLSTVDVFDICCIIADFVVVGGVRRAATIAIFSQEDEGMLQAKDVSTEWWIRYPWRARANISCALDPDTCTEEEFSRVFAACITGGGGEPGFLWVRHRSRYGCNPCAEISLRYQGLCNLTEVCIARCRDADEFIAAVGYASLLGTLQAGLTDFHYLRPIWQQNARDEALLGVSITGLAQRWELLTAVVMDAAVAVATYSNQQTASTIGIQPAKRIFCAKPSGSVSAVYGCTSGIAAAYSEYIIRRVRIDKTHPLAAALQIGLDEAKPPSTTEFQPVELDTGNSSNLVVSIPLHYKGGITTASETSIQLLERMLHFTKGLIGPTHFDGPNKHNVSLTCHYLPHELADIKAWLWEHRQDYSGVTLYPRSEAVHAQMPFEAITEDRYYELVGVWGGLYADFAWEAVDYSHHSDDRRETAACAGGACEVQ
jgi:ribonucleoside-diphosphate reductase alpha chain